VIVTDSNHVILSATLAETISQRYEAIRGAEKSGERK